MGSFCWYARWPVRRLWIIPWILKTSAQVVASWCIGSEILDSISVQINLNLILIFCLITDNRNNLLCCSSPNCSPVLGLCNIQLTKTRTRLVLIELRVRRLKTVLYWRYNGNRDELSALYFLGHVCLSVSPDHNNFLPSAFGSTQAFRQGFPSRRGREELLRTEL